MIPNARTATLMPIMERMIRPDSIVYTDGFSSYDALDVSDFHHVRINHSERFVDERSVSVRSGRGMGPVKRISHVEARPHKVLSFCW